MNGQLAKEQRRNLRKEIGATATDALERARHEVLQLRLANAAIAKELAEWKSVCQRMFVDFDTRDVALGIRIDGASAWSEKNEQGIAQARRHGDELFANLARVSYDRWALLGPLLFGNWKVRLKWALFGIPPAAWQDASGKEAVNRDES